MDVTIDLKEPGNKELAHEIFKNYLKELEQAHADDDKKVLVASLIISKGNLKEARFRLKSKKPNIRELVAFSEVFNFQLCEQLLRVIEQLQEQGKGEL